jgi:hypothetical protein
VRRWKYTALKVSQSVSDRPSEKGWLSEEVKLMGNEMSEYAAEGRS